MNIYQRLQKLRIRPYKRIRLALSMPIICLSAMGLIPINGRLPDFIIIGAQKGGSTWLRKNLEKHPQIFFPTLEGTSDPTEVRYFCQRLYRPLSWYTNLFRTAGNRLAGEKSPNYYMISKWRIRLIRMLMPDVKLILLLRNPIERTWSHALMNLVKLSKRNFNDVSSESFYGHFERTELKGHYTQVISHWEYIFDPKQIYIGFYDGIEKCPKQLLHEVISFLGVSTEVELEAFPWANKVNKGLGIPMPEEYRLYLQNMYHDEIIRLYKRFGDKVKNWCLDVNAESD